MFVAQFVVFWYRSSSASRSKQMPVLPETQKALGAYYTPRRVAEFLTTWAVRTSADAVLDPSAGEGVFLVAANRRMNSLGAPATRRLVGIELSPETVEKTGVVLSHEGVSATLVCRDFFECSPDDIEPVDALIGNPPFIRFHRFAGDARQLALVRAREAGVEMSALTSSWAPFLVHATRFLKPGGRMAVVAPGEVAHAAYAQPLVQHLCNSFARVRLLVFQRRLFPELSEDTVLVLADGKGQSPEGLSLHSFDDADSLNPGLDGGIKVEGSTLTGGVTRIAEYLLPTATRDLYRELCAHPEVLRLGRLADVGIGYVTGNNDYFHLTAEQIEKFSIPNSYVAPVIRRISDAPGIRFKISDWKRLHAHGAQNALLRIDPSRGHLPPGLRKYLRLGVKHLVHTAYKCRKRAPWYAVPHVHEADAFLSYMSGHEPRLVINRAKAFAPNTLHVVVMHRRTLRDRSALAVGWQSALVALSCEIEGHSLGGGLLKLEPGEAERVIVPQLKCDIALEAELDAMARGLYAAEVPKKVDQAVTTTLGLSHSDVRRLRDGAAFLRSRRTHR